jgi:hypothetical protein
MEDLIKSKKPSNPLLKETLENSLLEEILILENNKKVMITFISSVKKNLYELRKLRQYSEHLNYFSILVHLDPNIPELFFDKTVYDIDGTLFNLFEIDHLHDERILRRETNFEQNRKSAIFLILNSKIQHFKFFDLKIEFFFIF